MKNKILFIMLILCLTTALSQVFLGAYLVKEHSELYWFLIMFFWLWFIPAFYLIETIENESNLSDTT